MITRAGKLILMVLVFSYAIWFYMAFLGNNPNVVADSTCQGGTFLELNPDRLFWQSKVRFSSASSGILVTGYFSKYFIPANLIESIEVVETDDGEVFSDLSIMVNLDGDTNQYNFSRINLKCLSEAKLNGLNKSRNFN